MALEYACLFCNPRYREGRSDRGVGDAELLQSFGAMARARRQQDKEARRYEKYFGYWRRKSFHSFFLLSLHFAAPARQLKVAKIFYRKERQVRITSIVLFLCALCAFAGDIPILWLRPRRSVFFAVEYLFLSFPSFFVAARVSPENSPVNILVVISLTRAIIRPA